MQLLKLICTHQELPQLVAAPMVFIQHQVISDDRVSSGGGNAICPSHGELIGSPAISTYIGSRVKHDVVFNEDAQ